MADVQPTRTRSVRDHLANASKPLQPSAVATTSSSSSNSNTQISGITPSSPLSVFLRNLSLLDLDTLPDWPGLSATTFTTPSSGAQAQKKRVHCVEWALFQLFSIWDPPLARDKLKPFFPPLDQVQSTNLRAALLRALEQVKKNGDLGRDTLIRKTMLDDCKGERLEEVLASFSSAVLKKVIIDETAEHGEYATPVLNIALEPRGYKSDTVDLQILGLAHKVALRSVLESKMVADGRFRDFANLLDVGEKKLQRRMEEISDEKRKQRPDETTDAEYEELGRLVRNNWAGNEQWMNTLIYGDTDSASGGFMGMDLERLWRRVEQGRLSELEEAGAGLLEQLDRRIRLQKERMQKWDAFRRKIFGSKALVSPAKQKAGQQQQQQQRDRKRKGVNMGFTAHERLQFGFGSGLIRTGAVSASVSRTTPEYTTLIEGLMADLDRGQATSTSLDFLKYRQPLDTQSTSPATNGEEAISELSEFTEEEEEENIDEIYQSPIKPFHAKLEGAKRLPVRPKLAHDDVCGTSARNPDSTFRRPIMDDDDEEEEQEQEQDAEDETIKLDLAPRSVPANQRSTTASRSRSPVKYDGLSPQHSPSSEPFSPTQQLADQIIDSMDNFSPSPIKGLKQRPTLSLADRARLSMARGSAAFLDHEDEPELPTPVVSTRRVDSSKASIEGAVAEEPQDLIARTRKSMAGFEKAVQKAHLERRKSQRISKLPPRREGSLFPATVSEEVAQEDRVVLTEELMAQQDMEAVFRSRPKIAASPMRSPTRGWNEDQEVHEQWK